MPDPPPPAHAPLLPLLLHGEAERLAVGRALHNQVGQAFSAIKMAAHLTLDEADAEQRRQDLQEIVRACDESVALLRQLHAALYPPQLESLGLHAALRAECERLDGGRHAVALALAPLPREPSADVALVAFRIVQALLREAVAHGAARLASDADDPGAVAGFRLDVEARGATTAATWATALAAAAGGSLSSQSLDGQVRWRLWLPYASPSAPASPA